MMIIIAVVGCGKKQNNAKSQFIKDFDLNISKKDCEFEELFNNYEGFPYEGIALYKITKTSHTQNGICTLKIQYFS